MKVANLELLIALSEKGHNFCYSQCYGSSEVITGEAKRGHEGSYWFLGSNLLDILFFKKENIG